MIRICLLTLVFLFSLSLGVGAQETPGEEENITNTPSATTEDLKEQIIEIQNQGKFGIRHFIPCSKIQAIGVYTELTEPKFKQEETAYFYIEPENFFTRKSEGKYEIWISEDILILSERGETLMEKLGVVETHYNSASHILDVYFNNHVEFKGVPAGKYIFKVILYDKIKNTSASEVLPFEVLEVTPPQKQE